MHGADRYVTAGRFHALVEYREWEPGMLDSRPNSVELRRRTDEHAHFVRHHTLVGAVHKPGPDLLAFVFGRVEHLNGRAWPIEDRNRVQPLFNIPIDIRELGP
jgi:hypothetical protein